MPHLVDIVNRSKAVLFGLSTGRSAVAAFRLAAEWHGYAEFELHVMHVLPRRTQNVSAETAAEQGERAELLRRRAEAWLSDTLLTWHYRTVTGHPGAALTAEARRIGAAVILLGSAGRVADFVRARSSGTSTVVADCAETRLTTPLLPRAFALDAAHAGSHTHLTIGGGSS
jgi:nucleotide-binding universal stress UspA family protein